MSLLKLISSPVQIASPNSAFPEKGTDPIGRASLIIKKQEDEGHSPRQSRWTSMCLLIELLVTRSPALMKSKSHCKCHSPTQVPSLSVFQGCRAETNSGFPHTCICLWGLCISQKVVAVLWNILDSSGNNCNQTSALHCPVFPTKYWQLCKDNLTSAENQVIRGLLWLGSI